MKSARMECPNDRAPLRKRPGGTYGCPVCRKVFRPGELVESWQDRPEARPALAGLAEGRGGEWDRVADSTDPELAL